MKDKRQGNDLKVAWSIFMQDGEPFRLDGKDVSLYLKNMFGRKELNDFVTTGNIIQWTFYGKDQKNSGKYSLELVINEGEKGMITTDKCDFVNLVSCSCKLQGGEDAPNVETESIELTSTLEYVSGGGEYDDTALWKELENKVDKVDGKGLSSNDFTDAYVEQLASLDETYQPKGDYVETKNLATINGKPLNEGGNIEIESGSGGASIEVDSSLSITSTNPVQNKVITEALSTKLESEVVASSSPTEEIPLGYDDTEIWAKVDELSAEVGKKVDADFVNNAIAEAITTTLNTEV